MFLTKKIKEYNDKDFIGFHPYFNQHGGYKTYQIKFCEYCLINNINISKYFNIYEFIYKHATQNAYNHLKITLEQKQLAQNILNTYFNNFKKVYGEPND